MLRYLCCGRKETKELRKYTAKDFYESGVECDMNLLQCGLYYGGNKDINISFKETSRDFFYAMTLGCIEAPFALFNHLTADYSSNTNIKNPADLIVLLYAIALELTPEECKNISFEQRPTISEDIKPISSTLVALIKKAEMEISNQKLDENQVRTQIEQFCHILLPHSQKSLVGCFDVSLGQNFSYTEEFVPHMVRRNATVYSNKKQTLQGHFDEDVKKNTESAMQFTQIGSSYHDTELVLIHSSDANQQSDTSQGLLGESTSHD